MGSGGSWSGAKDVVVRVTCVTLPISSTPNHGTYTVSTTASSNLRVEGILFQFAPVNLAEEGPGVLNRSTLTGRGESAGDRIPDIAGVSMIDVQVEKWLMEDGRRSLKGQLIVGTGGGRGGEERNEERGLWEIDGLGWIRHSPKYNRGPLSQTQGRGPLRCERGVGRSSMIM